MLGFSPLASAPLGDAGDVSERIRLQRLVTGSPTVGSPEIQEVYNIGPLEAGAVQMGVPALTQEHDLNAVSISDAPLTIGVPACGSPVYFGQATETAEPTVGAPELTELYGIGTLLSGAPETGFPAITQEHDLTAGSIVAEAFLLGAPPCGSPLYFPVGVTAEGPTVGAPELTELSTILPLLTGAVQTGAPAITQEHDLQAIAISDAALSLGVPGCGSPVYFVANITTAAPTIGRSDLAERLTQPLTTGIPTLGVPAFSQVHNLDTDPPITGAASVGVVQIVPTFDFPIGVISGALELGSAQIAELAVSIVAGAPVTGASTLSIRFNFTAESIALGAPLLDDTALTQTHNLTAEPLATGAPDLQPALLAADVIGIVTLPPELGVIVLTQEHQLAAGDISSAPATPSGANITQIHGFTAESLVTDVPTVQITALTQTHNLTAEPLATGAPELGVVLPFMDLVSVFAGLPDLGSPAITQDHQIVADSIADTPPVMGSAALTQVHLLSAESLTASAPVTSFTTITQVHSLAAESLSFSAPEVGRPKMSYEVVSIVTGALQMGKPAITQDHQLVADNINAAPSTVAIAFFTQVHKLAAESLTGSRAIVPATTITQTHRLSAETLVTGAPIVPDIALSSLRFETPRNSANGGMLVGVQATAI